MVMISKEAMKDYENRAFSLTKLFMENVSKAEDLLVEDSPVDFTIHSFICSIHCSAHQAFRLAVLFWCSACTQDRDDADARELIKDFYSLEEMLTLQNKFFQMKLRKRARAAVMCAI